MKIDLPLETWTDLFAFLPRTQLAELLPQIDDRKFASFLQFFLLKCGKVTLHYLSITKSHGNGPALVRKLGHYGRELPLPDVPMPENIKNFTTIHLNYFNESILDFLKEFHRNSLFDNVHLDLSLCDSHLFLQVFPKILPLLSNIHSITTGNHVMSILQEEFSELAIPMLASVRFLTDRFNGWNTKLRHDWYSDWLCTPLADGQPRVLTLHPVEPEYDDTSGHMLSFVEHIKKNFMETKQPVSFCIHISWFWNIRLIENQFLDNSQTNEQLIVQLIVDPEEGYSTGIRISRYPSDANKEWFDGLVEKPPAELEYRNVELSVYEK